MAQQFFQGQEVFPGQSFLTDPANMTGFLVNAQGQFMAKRFQPGEQPNNGSLDSELQQFSQEQPLPPGTGVGPIAPRPGFGPGFQEPSGSAGQQPPPPGVGVGPIAPRPGFGPGFEGPAEPLRQLQPPPIAPRRVARKFTERLTAPGAGVGNQTIGSLLQWLFGNF